MTNRERCAAVERSPDNLSGSWAFRGTRDSVSTLFKNIKDGATVEKFLEGFPGVEGWKIPAVIDRSVYSAGLSRTYRNKSSGKILRRLL